MKYTSIYKNGKIQNFYIKATKKEYEAFLQNYFILTNFEHPRLGNIKEMSVLFSNDYKNEDSEAVYIGKQYHGWGYSASADVYGELLQAIKKLYKSELNEAELEELEKIDTHKEELIISDALLEKLGALSTNKLHEKWRA